MSPHRTLPSEVDAEALAELIDDCRQLPPAMLPRPRRPRPVVHPAPTVIRIPEATASYVEGYGEYGG